MAYIPLEAQIGTLKSLGKRPKDKLSAQQTAALQAAVSTLEQLLYLQHSLSILKPDDTEDEEITDATGQLVRVLQLVETGVVSA